MALATCEIKIEYGNFVRFDPIQSDDDDGGGLPILTPSRIGCHLLVFLCTLCIIFSDDDAVITLTLQPKMCLY